MQIRRLLIAAAAAAAITATSLPGRSLAADAAPTGTIPESHCATAGTSDSCDSSASGSVGGGSAKWRKGADADLVLVLPASNHASFARQKKLLRPWLEKQHLSYSLVPLWRILHGRPASALTAEEVRQYMRQRFTWRTSTGARPRYFGIFAVPTPDYMGTAAALPSVPRFGVTVGSSHFDSDVPYEFLAPATPDGGDGSIDPGDLNMTSPTFDVFRVPITRAADLSTFVRRDAAFGRATAATPAYGHDVTLAAGTFGLFPGDTSAVQCLNASALQQQQLADHVFKVFDSTVCSPDVQTRPEGPRLADFLADPTSPFRGGVVVDISHGGPNALYGRTAAGAFFPNLTVGDVARIPTDRLNVFISIACDNDGLGVRPNLAAAMYERASIAVISATTQVTPVSWPDIKAAEVDSVIALYQHHDNLLQNLHAFRSDYYQRFVRPAAPGAQQLLWINLLTVNLIGDGFVTVAR
jgi:hypothetical protein